MKRYIAGFASASCFGMLCACAARSGMMLHVAHGVEACLKSLGLL
jgi:hypothetical protein